VILGLLPRLRLSSNVLGFDVSKVLVEEFEGASLLRELGEIRLETGFDGLRENEMRRGQVLMEKDPAREEGEREREANLPKLLLSSNVGSLRSKSFGDSLSVDSLVLGLGDRERGSEMCSSKWREEGRR